MTRLRVALAAGAVALICSFGLAGPQPAARAADGSATWVSAPGQPPPTPPGAEPSPYPLPLGYVGDIEFWAPNRGLLITAGNSVVPQGLYAYDGVSWHELSTVCGGTDGRIAWAGPDEFWTIADQRPGQVLPTGATAALQDVSLCHFDDGAVVGSYALPLDQPNSYRPMNAAACAAPDNCWFGGELDAVGAFHLHWDGSNISVVDGEADHEIASMTVDDGQIFESVQLGLTDAHGSEDPNHPPLLHVIVPSAANPFHSLFLADAQDPVCGEFCPPLPDYGTDSDGNPVAPATLNGLALDSDFNAGAGDPQLWAAAGADSASPPAGEGTAGAVVLRYADGTWTQVVPNLVSLPGDDVPVGNIAGVTPSAEAVAAEPNESAAWIAVVSSSLGPDNQAHVDRIAVDGTTGATITDQDVLGTAQGVGPRGNAAAIACPAAQDCWLATDQGWLFHLTGGTALLQDTDPNFAGVITSRPSDAGIPAEEAAGTFVPTAVPPPPPVVTTTTVPASPRTPAKALVTHVSRSRLVHRTTLELSFTLTATARVQLIARRHGRIVARTRRTLLRPGRHTLKLALNRHRWPTALALKAKSA